MNIHLTKSGLVTTARTETLRIAAGELERYVEGMCGARPERSEIVADNAIVLGTPADNPWIADRAESLALAKLKPDGFVIAPVEADGKRVLAIAANDDAGALYGVYGFAEHCGVRFRHEAYGGDIVPECRDVRFDHATRNEPAFRVRGTHARPCDIIHDETTYYETNILDYWPQFEADLDWMAKYRQNLYFPSFFISAAENFTDIWAPGNTDAVVSGIDGLIMHKAYPKMEWEKNYGEQIARNQELFHRIISYGKARGIKTVFHGGGEPNYPGRLLRFYPEFKENGHVLCGALDRTWDYVRNRLREFFETFPDLAGVDIALTSDVGGRAANLIAIQGHPLCPECRRLGSIPRILKMFDTVKEAKTEAGSEAEIWFWNWGGFSGPPSFLSMLDDEGDKPGCVCRELTPQLNALLPEDVVVLNEPCDNEENDRLTNWWTGRWSRRHREILLDIRTIEPMGGFWFPTGFVAAGLKSQYSYCLDMGLDGIVSGTLDWVGKDGSGIGLLEVDRIGAARLQWNPNADTENVWREWADAFFPEAADDAIEIMRGAYERMAAIAFSDATGFNTNDLSMGVSMLMRKMSNPERMLDLRHHNSQGETLAWKCVDRRVGLAWIREKDRAVELIEDALAEVAALKDRLGPEHADKYALWEKNLTFQRWNAVLVRGYVRSYVHRHFMQHDMAEDGDIGEMKRGLEKIETAIKNMELPPIGRSYSGSGYLLNPVCFDALKRYMKVCHDELRRGDNRGEG